MRATSTKRLLAAGTLAALFALTACGGGGGSSSKASSDSAQSPAGAMAESAGGSGYDAPSTGSGVKDAVGANRSAIQPTAVIRTGDVALTAKDVGAVRAEIDSLLTALGGTIGDEQSTSDKKGRLQRSTLELRIPVDKFDVARKAVMKMGTLKSSHQGGRDVTTEVIDVEERVQTLQTSLDDLQRYQEQAKTVRDLIALEDKITARQAELQSLKAQQSYLRDQTAMSTLTVYLSTPSTYVPPPGALEGAGFWPGLKAGWHALVDTVVVALTLVGVLLPFLVVVALVGVPVWLAVRALLRRRRLVTPEASTPSV